MLSRCMPLALTAVLAWAPAARAQADPPAAPARLFVGGGLLVGQPIGEFDDYIDHGFGIGGHLIYRLDPGGWLGIRLDGGFVIYGRETKRVCFSSTVGCRITLDLETTNNIAFGSIGPQIVVPAGRFAPYLGGSVGFSYFSTESSVEGSTGQQDEFARTRNQGDATLAWGAASGIYIPIRRAPTPISIDLGVRYHRNGRAEYLREGDIVDHPDGSITLLVNRSEANLLTFQLGVSVGVRSGDRSGIR